MSPAPPVAVPKDAATVILLREASQGLEVLLLRRPFAQKFMGGAWVFPGGTVAPGDGEGDEGLRGAAARELGEEAGVTVAAADLLPWARWITPEREPMRFDARFYLALLPAGAEVRPDPREVVDVAWLSPSDALVRSARGELRVMPPTLRNLELLARFARYDEVSAAARTADLSPVQPQLEMVDGLIMIVLPGDPLHAERERRVPGPTRIVLRESGFVSEDPP